MIYYTILSIAGLFGLIYLFFTKDRYAWIILALQVLSITLSIMGIESLLSIGLWLYTASVVLVFIHAYSQHEIKASARRLMMTSSVAVVLTHLFQLLHLPGAGWLGLSMVFPIIALIPVLADVKNTRNYFGFVVIMAADGLVELMMRFHWLFSG